MSHSASTRETPVDAPLRAQLESLVHEGSEIWDRFDCKVRQQHWHPFVAADYERVLQTLLVLRRPGMRFLEWGSATGIITILADLLGFEAYGIELDPSLVGIARRLANKYGSQAHFAVGSFVPAGYVWRSSTGDPRKGTIGEGISAYPELNHPLEDFDLVYAYPWKGEEPMMQDIMRCYGGKGARLLLHDGTEAVQLYTNGRLES